MKTATLFCLACTLAGAQDFRVLDPVAARPQSLTTYLHGLADQQLAQRRAEIENIKTPEQLEQRRAKVRSTLLKLIGGLPAERTPLNLKRIGRLDRGDYRVEKVIYESLPGFYVTASLYIPQSGQPPYPAVIQPLGHSMNAKAGGIYQSLSIGLAKYGFVVLTYDPIGQGERRIFWDGDIENSKVGGPTAEHSMVGRQSLLAGESVARYRIWDGMRGIDLLQSLPEVDPKRIGVSGCSGGGTLTAYIAALDDRVQAAAPACYISAWEEQLEGTGPQDAEQQFPDQLRLGLNHGDFAIALAPKPYLICNTTEDFFPLDGGTRTYEELKRIYALLGAGEKIARYIGPGGHGMNRDTREAIYAWMKRWLKGDPPAPASEPSFKLEAEEDLYCTRTGQVADSLGGETASTLNVRRLEKIQPSRPVKDVAEKIRSLSRYQRSGAPLEIRSFGTVDQDGFRFEKVAYAADVGRIVPALLCMPAQDRDRKRAVLYVDQAGKSRASALQPDLAELARMGFTVLAVDPSGIGETAVHDEDSGPGYLADGSVWLALMVGKPVLGIRIDEILRGLDVLRERNLLYDGRAIGFAKGLIGTTLLHAAALDARIDALILEGNLVSYHAVAAAPIHRNVFEALIPGVLDQYDLPDLAAAVAPRPVWLVNTVSPLRNPMPSSRVEAAYRTAATQNLKVRRRASAEPLMASYGELLGETR
ncbi:MAG TPA: alpha/beta hydrolase family protein [Bryobacteraceae bacterium]|nr:alpha/beta hydrolase family protein [Bryobacteraceae bacterium]